MFRKQITKMIFLKMSFILTIISRCSLESENNVFTEIVLSVLQGKLDHKGIFIMYGFWLLRDYFLSAVDFSSYILYRVFAVQKIWSFP